MADPETYQLKSAVFTPSGGAAYPIASLLDVSVNVGGQKVTWSTDGVATVQRQTMEDIEGSVTISVTDQSKLHSSNVQVGVSGSLVITLQKRKDGRGAVSGTDLTITAAEAMVESNREGAPHRGVGSGELVFSVVDIDGVYPFAYA